MKKSECIACMHGINLRNYYESEANFRRFWGSTREKTLVENILYELHPDVKQETRILEVGIGDGYLLYSLDSGSETVGIDISSTRARKAKKVGSSHLIVADGQKLPLRTNSFNYVVCSETLEHIPNYRQAIAEAFRVLGKGGIYLITVPFRHKPVKLLCPFCFKVFSVVGHLNWFSESRLTNNLEGSNFVVKRVYGFGSSLAYNNFVGWKFFGLRKLIDYISYKLFGSAKYIMCVSHKQ